MAVVLSVEHRNKMTVIHQAGHRYKVFSGWLAFSGSGRPPTCASGQGAPLLVAMEREQRPPCLSSMPLLSRRPGVLSIRGSRRVHKLTGVWGIVFSNGSAGADPSIIATRSILEGWKYKSLHRGRGWEFAVTAHHGTRTSNRQRPAGREELQHTRTAAIHMSQ